MTMSVGKKMMYTMGTLAAGALMTLSLGSCKNNQPTNLEKAKANLELAQSVYTLDSLFYANHANDSVKAREALAYFQNLRTEYLLGHPRTGTPEEMAAEEKLNTALKDDNRLDSLNAGIRLAQSDVDKTTGKRVQASKQNLQDAKNNYRIEELLEKERNNTITMEERIECYKLISNKMIYNTDKNNYYLQEIDDMLKSLGNSREDSIMSEFREKYYGKEGDDKTEKDIMLGLEMLRQEVKAK